MTSEIAYFRKPWVSWLRQPTLAPLLENRRLATVIALAGAAQIVLTWSHIGGMDCPLMRTTGLPCPGCGLSRACVAFLHGDFHDALTLHAFAPILLTIEA